MILFEYYYKQDINIASRELTRTANLKVMSLASYR